MSFANRSHAPLGGSRATTTGTYVALLLPFCLALIGATAHSPQEAYEANIAQENQEYASDLHAMLKIQDSVYLEDGQSTVLAGTAGTAASWRWYSRGTGLLRISLAHGQLTITKDGERVDPALAGSGIAVDTDIDVAGAATQINAGVEGWRFFVYNQKSPDALKFRGVSYYPFNSAFIVQAAFMPDTQFTVHTFPTSRGTTKNFFHVGDASFVLQGKQMQLPFYSQGNNAQDVKEMSAFFTDELSGKGAYAAGRYLEVSAEGYPPGTITIDFNQAYNPNCARSAHFTCPIADASLPVAIYAGERDPHVH